MALAFHTPIHLQLHSRPAALLPSSSPSPLFISSRPLPHPHRRCRTITTASLNNDHENNANNSNNKSSTKPQFSRRQVVQLINGVLGLTTLSLLVKMKEQFRLISPQAILASLGLTRLPSRSALPSANAATITTTTVQPEALAYIKHIDSRPPLRTPDFPRGADWINTKPLSLNSELAGKVVLLDFFTYCCINCQHVLPKLRALEDKYGPDGSAGFVVVGVHSAKFSAERETRNIAAAVERYDVRHPVVNDERMVIWNAVGVSSWPTLALLGPKGNLLAVWAGERQEQDIDALVAAALEYYADDIDHRPLPQAPKARDYAKLAESPLRYPGKLAMSATGNKLFVTDSGNNRVLELDEQTTKVLRTFGSGEPGFADAQTSSKAQFHSPQGIVEHDGVVFVADTESHAVRAIDLASGAVSTIGGDGEQGFDYEAGKMGKAQQLSSPWDVEVVNEALYVAMAGTHQIWRLPLVSGGGIKQFASTPWEVFSGTGRELEKNSTNCRTASWAQPSHLSYGPNGVMYIADSESSSLRSIEMNSSSHPTKTIAGGDGLIPENLFAFGDEEGRGSRAKFQHPLAVCYDNNNNRVFVADSYNHRIKVVDDTGYSKVFCGSGKPGLKDGGARDAMFWEPAGLTLSPDGKKLYVSDTNNFAIRSIDIESKNVRTLKVSSSMSVAASSSGKPLIPYRRRAIVIDGEVASPSSSLKFLLSLPERSHFTTGTTSRYQVNVKSNDSTDDSLVVLTTGAVSQAGSKGTFSVDLSTFSNQIGSANSLEVETVTYYCTEVDDVCRTEADIFNIQLSASGAPSSELTHKIAPRRAPMQNSSLKV